MPFQPGELKMPWSIRTLITQAREAIRTTSLPPLVVPPTVMAPDDQPPKGKRRPKGPIVSETAEELTNDFGIYAAQQSTDGRITALADGRGWTVRTVRRMQDLLTSEAPLPDYVAEVDISHMVAQALEMLADEQAPIPVRHTAKQLLRVLIEVLHLSSQPGVNPAIVMSLIAGQHYERMRVELVQAVALRGKLDGVEKSDGGNKRARPDVRELRIRRYRDCRDKCPHDKPYEICRLVAEMEVPRTKRESYDEHQKRVKTRRNTLRKWLPKAARDPSQD